VRPSADDANRGSFLCCAPRTCPTEAAPVSVDYFIEYNVTYRCANFVICKKKLGQPIKADQNHRCGNFVIFKKKLGQPIKAD